MIQKGLPESPVYDATSVFPAIPIQNLLQSTLTKRAAALYYLECSKLRDKRVSFVLVESLIVIVDFQSLICLEFLRLLYSRLEHFSLVFHRDFVLWCIVDSAQLFCGRGKQRLGFSDISRAANFNRLGGSFHGLINRRSIRRARSRTWSVPLMLPITVPRNARQSFTDAALGGRIRMRSI